MVSYSIRGIIKKGRYSRETGKGLHPALQCSSVLVEYGGQMVKVLP